MVACAVPFGVDHLTKLRHVDLYDRTLEAFPILADCDLVMWF